MERQAGGGRAPDGDWGGIRRRRWLDSAKTSAPVEEKAVVHPDVAVEAVRRGGEQGGAVVDAAAGGRHWRGTMMTEWFGGRDKV
ncbi:hypothetical protein OsI_01921 [Oryza sativa Indica Group]|uniref:Uncharacterized protein n=1 Tax=Oryza sativa subsp. indica TaxID=39946 RepID=B8A8A2_ORYSI|nr:hypothetical protein OsI_01921 [Oryza sativa Indica Group]